MKRDEFVRKACITGACMCGFAAAGAFAVTVPANELLQKDEKIPLPQQWLSELLSNLSSEIDPDTLRRIIRKSADVHYRDLDMDKMLSAYVGDLQAFVTFISNEWGWKIDYDREKGTLIADENKKYCVCPVLEAVKGQETSAICYCSEGFAEKMFSTVTGKNVKASVISSVRRGDETCRYRIILG